MVIRQFFQWLSFLISPPTCVCCATFLEERIPLCSCCEAEIKPIVSCDMPITKKYTMKVHAVSQYEGVIRTLIIAKQFGNRLPSHQLGYLIGQRTLCRWSEYDYIVPVPLHWQRYAWRGFNQAQEIAQVLSKRYGIPLAKGIQRIRATRYQASLGQEARTMNVKNVFIVQEKYQELYRNKRLLLVDDVMTTGSTLRELAQVLTRYSPQCLEAVVAARVVLDQK